MSRHAGQRLTDIEIAIAAIDEHVRRGDLSDGLVFDAVRVRLIEIGKAVKGLTADLTSSEPHIPWQEVARMRDHMAGDESVANRPRDAAGLVGLRPIRAA